MHHMSQRTIVFALAVLMSSSTAQQPTIALPPKSEGFPIEKVSRTPGDVLARGSNETPSGKLNVKTYRLERVKLEKPFARGDGKIQNYEYRLVITGGPFPNGYLVWINDLAVPALHNSNETELIAFLGAPDYFLEDGAPLVVTRGATTCAPLDASVSELPEKLSVPLELRTAPPAPNTITLRSARTRNGRSAVRVTVRTKELLPIGDSQLFIQVGKQSFLGGGIGYKAETIVPYEAFAGIPDNSQVILNWGHCSPGGMVMGRLNKSSLDH